MISPQVLRSKNLTPVINSEHLHLPEKYQHYEGSHLTLRMKLMNTTDFLKGWAMTSQEVKDSCLAASTESRISFHLAARTDALLQHARRAVFQAGIWSLSDQPR
ncbi:uncharacterized protein LOC123520691 isoform X4 [Portunus trituberculatus]|uniref:uncharacterized protein LOC123520691 isoform X4 n=1 Tax=Portunus trituberculatus TaxID=210409 RepID=UPI001E1D0365|nr:uncharacterized protein LOC123520691 isoform X4 [Portunus trituberculatus]